MKYIILAAGIGSRLLPATDTLPKILVPIKAGMSTLDFQLRAIALQKFITEVILVVGYKRELVENYLVEHYAQYPTPIRLVINDKFERSGALYSLLLASRGLDGADFIVANGDVIFETDLLESIATLDSGYTLFVSEITDGHRDAIKVTIEGELVIKLGKKIEKEKANGLSMGIFVAKGLNEAKLAKAMIEKLGTENPDLIWHSLIEELIKMNQVKAHFCSRSTWHEMDNQIDLHYAKIKKSISYE